MKASVVTCLAKAEQAFESSVLGAASTQPGKHHIPPPQFPPKQFAIEFARIKQSFRQHNCQLRIIGVERASGPHMIIGDSSILTPNALATQILRRETQRIADCLSQQTPTIPIYSWYHCFFHGAPTGNSAYVLATTGIPRIMFYPCTVLIVRNQFRLIPTLAHDCQVHARKCENDCKRETLKRLCVCDTM